jgi:hypothetical protein
LLEGGGFGRKMERFFLDDWGSPYAALVDPCAAYEAPRTHD